MISDELYDQAALYVLGALSAEEKSVFEQELRANAELQDAVRELREVAAGVALSAPQVSPTAEVKARVLSQIADEKGTVVPMPSAPPARGVFSTWVPWAIAAGLVGFCGVLLVERSELREQLAASQQVTTQPTPTPAPEARPVVLVALKPAEGGPADAQAVVAWDPAQQAGTIKVANLPLQQGKDYQLWAVDAAHADPISAGIVRVDQNGVGQVQFKPVTPASQVKAFAISLEREGGVPKREGPILLLGTV